MRITSCDGIPMSQPISIIPVTVGPPEYIANGKSTTEHTYIQKR